MSVKAYVVQYTARSGDNPANATVIADNFYIHPQFGHVIFVKNKQEVAALAHFVSIQEVSLEQKEETAE